MLEEDRLANLDASRINGPDFVASVVFCSVPKVETRCRVFSPRFSLVWSYMEIDGAPKWRPRILIVVVFSI